jgi:hypothetical protein
VKLDADRVLSITAMIVGVGSLVAVIYQTQLDRASAELDRETAALERRAQSASVLPYLMVVTTMNSDGVFLNVRNTGLGPARIESVRVLHNGGSFDGDAVDFYMKFRADPKLGIDIDQLKPGRLVPAGEWIRTLGVPGENRHKMLPELLRLFEISELQKGMYDEYDRQAAEGTLKPREKGVLEITYASVFGERWVLRSDNMVPQPATGRGSSDQ